MATIDPIRIWSVILLVFVNSVERTITQGLWVWYTAHVPTHTHTYTHHLLSTLTQTPVTFLTLYSRWLGVTYRLHKLFTSARLSQWKDNQKVHTTTQGKQTKQGVEERMRVWVFFPGSHSHRITHTRSLPTQLSPHTECLTAEDWDWGTAGCKLPRQRLRVATLPFQPTARPKRRPISPKLKPNEQI